jgi:hypothetical protein
MKFVVRRLALMPFMISLGVLAFAVMLFFAVGLVAMLVMMLVLDLDRSAVDRATRIGRESEQRQGIAQRRFGLLDRRLVLFRPRRMLEADDVGAARIGRVEQLSA